MGSCFELLKSSLFYTARLKCLVVLFSDFIQMSSVKQIMQQAWKFNFLDFILLQIGSENNDSQIVNLNPFSNKFVIKNTLILVLNQYQTNQLICTAMLYKQGFFHIAGLGIILNLQRNFTKKLKFFIMFINFILPALSNSIYLDINLIIIKT